MKIQIHILSNHTRCKTDRLILYDVSLWWKARSYKFLYSCSTWPVEIFRGHKFVFPFGPYWIYLWFKLNFFAQRQLLIVGPLTSWTEAVFLAYIPFSLYTSFTITDSVMHLTAKLVSKNYLQSTFGGGGFLVLSLFGDTERPLTRASHMRISFGPHTLVLVKHIPHNFKQLKNLAVKRGSMNLR